MEVLITGGSEGIGRGLAARFLKAGHRVMVTGRDELKLQQAASELPGLEIFANDIGSATEREVLAQYIERVMPGLDVLINNAGIQRRISLAADYADWTARQTEIDILFSGPAHLNHLLYRYSFILKRKALSSMLPPAVPMFPRYLRRFIARARRLCITTR
jgi:uncharacterized oxidoreductase